MKINPKLFLISLLAISLTGCVEIKETTEPITDTYNFSQMHTLSRDVDLLFVIDNSLSMAEEQSILKAQFQAMVDILKRSDEGLPNLHIGVISADLGSLPYNLPSCELPGGDNGSLLKGTCVNPKAQHYIVDVEPAGCSFERDDPENPSLCTSHDCTELNCTQDAFTPDRGSNEPGGLSLFEDDENGCPRCRNYEGEELWQVFGCIGDLGIMGCGFEQFLEVMYKAFTEANPENSGFFRDGAITSIFFLTDEDDCSAKNSEIFNPAGGIQDTLGPLTSFRCTEFGITCDEEWKRLVSYGGDVYNNCTSRSEDDPKSMLYPISRYIDYLLQNMNSYRILVTAVAGFIYGPLHVGTDENHNPKLTFSCDEAVPSVRLKEFTQAFNQDTEQMDLAFSPICGGDYTVEMEGLGERILHRIGVTCLNHPLLGCPDPAAANRLTPVTELPTAIAEFCKPECTLHDIHSDGSLEQIFQCPVDYMSGHPSGIDPNLPISVCYHVQYDPKCAMWSNHSPSRGGIITISRREISASGSETIGSCQGFSLTEENCSDDIDNDFDGKIDSDDMDCQNH